MITIAEIGEQVELKKQLEDMFGGIREHVEFTYQAGEIWDWIKENRIVFGEPWNWNYSKLPIKPGKYDRKYLKLREDKNRFYLTKAPRPYLRQYINDDSPIKSCIKCRQSEFTENEININLYYASTHKYYNIRHLFPTAGVAKKVAKERIDIAVNTSPNLKKRILKPYNITEKHFHGHSFYTVDGAFNEFGGRGPNSDRIVFDEYNFHNPKIKEVYSASTDHSQHGGQQIYISTPTFPNMGIDKEYQDGCQYKWFFTCPGCKMEQDFQFPYNIINFVEKGSALNREKEDELLDNAYIGCRYCKRYIDRGGKYYTEKSRWMAKFPKRKNNSSYSVLGFMLPWVSGKALNEEYLRMRFINQFYNEKIGVSFIGDSSRVLKQEVEACQDFGFRNIMRANEEAKNVSIGIDWGAEESWLIAVADGIGVKEEKDIMRILFAFRINKESLAKHGFGIESNNHVKLAMKVIDIMRANLIINDANGIGIRDNATLYKKYGAKSFGAFYDTKERDLSKINKSSIIVKFNDSSGTVTIPRTVELTATMDIFKNKEPKIPKIETKTLWLFVDHIHSLASTSYYDEENDRVVIIVGHIGPDHFAHAFTYARVGYEKLKINSPREKKKRLRVSGQSKNKAA